MVNQMASPNVLGIKSFNVLTQSSVMPATGHLCFVVVWMLPL